MPDMDVVAAVRARLAGAIGQTRYDLWFGSQTRLVPQGDTLVVEAPNRFYQDWLRRNFRDALVSSYHETIGRMPRLEFRIAEPVAAGQVAVGHAARVPDKESTAPPEDAHASRVCHGLAGPSRRFASLDSLVPGEGNHLALHAARMVLSEPGKISPLFIHGPTGIGKTHLLEGIYSEVRRGRGQAVYLSAEQFTNAFLEALHGSGLPSFRRKHRGVQWLLLDDVQFFHGKKATISELLHTIDTALREGRQLVLAADRPPQDLPGLSDELVTRLQSGLTCAMQPPDLEMRLGILRSLARELELSVSDAVAEFIATHLTAHARELCGALKLLKVTCQSRGCPLTVTLAREALADMIRVSSPAVGLAEIEQAVCSVFGLEPKRLQASDGARAANQPRMLAMFLARKYTRAALSEIGRYFGRRSHSTVISAQKRVKDWMASGESLRVSDQEWPASEALRRVEARLRVG
jgi:chromosomal replication initiator protein